VAELTRREVLKRGAAVGGTLLWATPVVQSLGVRSAWAQVYGQDISFICLNLLCASGGVFVKIQCNESGMCTIESGATKCNPHCDFEPVGGGGGGGVTPGNRDPRTGCVTVTIPADCEITASVVKAGQRCCPGPPPPTGPGNVEFCPPTC
jgi:hypothetical protein